MPHSENRPHKRKTQKKIKLMTYNQEQLPKMYTSLVSNSKINQVQRWPEKIYLAIKARKKSRRTLKFSHFQNKLHSL